MPTEQDILETRELIEGRNYSRVTVFPLFARLSGKDQQKIFAPISNRKIIIATNIAETSITIPGIKYVIDTGFARIPRYSPRTRTTSLPVSPISKSSADQRKGRCGRVANGICIRLFSEDDYMSRPLYTAPEILRANLAEVILRMLTLNLGEISNFPFIDSPAPKSISDGFDLLLELGAISHLPSKQKKKTGSRDLLTPKGYLMSKIPVDPRIACMLLEARQQGCLKEVLIIASVLSIMDPRERPIEKAQVADEKHRAFADPLSDFLLLLNIWNRYHETKTAVKSNNRMKRFCKDNFLSYRRMREWRDIHSQLSDILTEAGVQQIGNNRKNRVTKEETNGFHPLYTAIHQSILSGFLSNIALKKENNIYKAPKGREVMIFPGSALFGKAPTWIVAAEIVQTNRVYARTVAAIQDKWLEKIGKPLCKYTWLNPRWDRRRGEVIATEQVSLFGLVIVSGRGVSYGRVNPEEATAIFIREALVEGEMDTPFAFMAHNNALIQNVQNIENKLRRRDILVSKEDLFTFYITKLADCYDIRTLKHRLKKAPDDSFLRLQQDDLFRFRPCEEELALYPDRLKMGQVGYTCEYRFDPGKEEDGLTVKVPVSLAPQISGDQLDWLVPGLHKEKITSLIKGLPKSHRKRLVPVAETVDIIISEMPANKGALPTALSNFIHKRFGVDIPAKAWSDQNIPDHLKMRIAITGENGKEIRAGRDKSILTRSHSPALKTDGLKPIRKKWERFGIQKWDIPDLPDSLSFTEKNGTQWILYPALFPGSEDVSSTHSNSVNLILSPDYHKAIEAHKKGVAVLYAHHFSKDLKFLKKNLTLPSQIKESVKDFGGKLFVEEELYKRVMIELFHKDIRTKVAFETHARQVSSLILAKGQELLDLSLPIIMARHETKNRLTILMKENRFNPLMGRFFKDLSAGIDQLVPPNFITLYDTCRIANLERYLKAVIIRAQRALVNLEKDQAKAKEINIFTDKLGKMLKTLTSETSVEKRHRLEDVFWLIEEYKVSVFAQELKTPVKISAKKLAVKINELERMV